MTTAHPESPSHPARAWQGSAFVAIGVVGTVLLASIALGHDGRRTAQMLLLAVPALSWLAWPVRGASGHRARSVSVWLWTMAFVLDGVARAYLQQAYQAAPDSALVLGAVANSNAREVAEYLAMQWRSIAVWSTVLVCAVLLTGRFAGRGARKTEGQGTGTGTGTGIAPRRTWCTWCTWRRWQVWATCIVLLFVSLAYASKPWRRLHPVLFWPQWAESVRTLRAGWADQQRERDHALQRAKALSPTVSQPGPATVVLVITDSVNRDNMSLYGYERPTTPALLAQKAQLGPQMLVLKNAWSVDASTLPALRNMFNFGQPERSDPLHVLALARAAGYKTWWISNHDDVAIEQQHGRLADVLDMVNRTPGRASASMDSELLDCVQEALDATDERKLIVVHLMGAHPHYKLRFPEGQNPFDDSPDAVERQLVSHGRPAWMRQFRADYDAAMLYHDSVVSSLFKMTRNTGDIGKPEAYRAWMYLSDHGQEVGHETDRAGHSPSTRSGYRIPTVIWRSQPSEYPASIEDQPFRADWTAWALTDLLNIHWHGDDPSHNVLNGAYHWQAPVLPVEVKSFMR